MPSKLTFNVLKQLKTSVVDSEAWFLPFLISCYSIWLLFFHVHFLLLWWMQCLILKCTGFYDGFYNMHLLCMLNLYIVTFWPKTEILEFKLEWRFKIILRLYIEVGWAVSQLEGIDLIRSLTIYPIFMFWYMNVEWWYREYHYIMMQRKLSRFHFWYGVV